MPDDFGVWIVQDSGDVVEAVTFIKNEHEYIIQWCYAESLILMKNSKFEHLNKS
jgi:hypothetical protein